MKLQPEEIKKIALTVIDTEATAITNLREQVGKNFVRACELLAGCRGRVVFTGMGKSGHIAKKISSTFASTGHAAFYIHPAEAGHGDLGMIGHDDVVVMISYSGETDEVNVLLPPVKRLGVPLIALTGSPDSTLAENADAVINTNIREEACPLGLAPTASTTATLAMGDALAAVLQSDKGFTPEDFARAHPSGRLGKRLTVKVADLMRTGKDVPKVAPNTLLPDALCEMSRKGLGMTLIVDKGGGVIGIFTDGDLRRSFESAGNIKKAKVESLMTREFHAIIGNALAYEALQLMRRKSINSMPVFNANGKLVGALNMHDLLSAGL